MANRVAEVNKALRARGAEEKLTRGRGYYYFRDGSVGYWPATSVYVYRAEDMTVSEWLDAYNELAAMSQQEA